VGRIEPGRRGRRREGERCRARGGLEVLVGARWAAAYGGTRARARTIITEEKRGLEEEGKQQQQPGKRKRKLFFFLAFACPHPPTSLSLSVFPSLLACSCSCWINSRLCRLLSLPGIPAWNATEPNSWTDQNKNSVMILVAR